MLRKGHAKGVSVHPRPRHHLEHWGVLSDFMFFFEVVKTGEHWETAFCKALCSSSVVIPIISRATFCDAAKIHEDSPCDNVILEFDLALSLNLLKGTAVMPLFVGDTVFLSIEILSSSCSLHMCNNKEELFQKHRKRTTKDSFISPITSSRSALPSSQQPRSG